MINFDNYNFRASGLGNIMAGVPKPLSNLQEKKFYDLSLKARGIGAKLSEAESITYYGFVARKKEKCKLTDGAKSHLEKLVWNEVTGRQNKIKSKYLEKGIVSEEQAITLYSNVNKKLFLKNKERKMNDFFSGECDNVTDIIRDIKCSWEYNTFPLTDRKIESKLYQWQGQVYMNLWGLLKFELIYCLIDTPEHLVNKELIKLGYDLNIFNLAGDVREEYIDLVVEVVSDLIFTFRGIEKLCSSNPVLHIEWFKDFKEIPDEIRLKIFEMEYSPKMIDQAKEMVVLSRKYMNSVLLEMGDNIIKFNNLNEQKNA